MLVLVVALPFALTHRQDLPLERIYGDAAVSVVSQVLGGNATNPVANDRRALDTGRIAYTGSCAVCHGAKGDGRGVFGPTTYPDATDFTTEAAKSKSDAQLFWIVKNGLGFTAMPAFSGQYKDAEIWAMVAYIRALQRGGASTLAIPTPSAAQLGAADPGDASTRTGAPRPGPARARRRLRRRRLRRFGACSTWGKYAQTGRADARRYPARSALIGSRPPRPFGASPLRVSQEGFEPTTKRLRVSCSTAELLAPSKWYRRASSTINQLVHQSVNLVHAKRGHSWAR